MTNGGQDMVEKSQRRVVGVAVILARRLRVKGWDRRQSTSMTWGVLRSGVCRQWVTGDE